ncbi:hypothetical protein BC829DRAFT_383165 [Chytridium lagenaria]|nr:hypothetical protein BC829DRAFT_383165 [Chytridium lagenaria]
MPKFGVWLVWLVAMKWGPTPNRTKKSRLTSSQFPIITPQHTHPSVLRSSWPILFPLSPKCMWSLFLWVDSDQK